MHYIEINPNAILTSPAVVSFAGGSTLLMVLTPPPRKNPTHQPTHVKTNLTSLAPEADRRAYLIYQLTIALLTDARSASEYNAN